MTFCFYVLCVNHDLLFVQTVKSMSTTAGTSVRNSNCKSSLEQSLVQESFPLHCCRWIVICMRRIANQSSLTMIFFPAISFFSLILCRISRLIDRLIDLLTVDNWIDFCCRPFDRYTWPGDEWAGIAQWLLRAPDSWLKGRGFESLQERRYKFIVQGQLSVLLFCRVSVSPPCYAVACKTYRSFYYKCSYYTAKHAYTLRM